jgi:predicted ATPase/transcriptional regulator with XRE-family HTH domain
VNQDEANEFGILLHEYRGRAGLTQIQLADLSTVSVRAIRDLELGSAKRPRRDTVRLLAAGLRLGAQRRVNFELAAGGNPATAAFDAVSGTQAMPRPSGPMYGRDAEHRALAELLVSGAHRLVTLTGLAGIGKTRLALTVAYELHDTGRMRMLWLPAPEIAGQPAPPAAPRYWPAQSLATWIRPLLSSEDGRLDDLAELIGTTPLLLVLDGIDSTDAASRPSSASLCELLASCPNLRVLLTARASTEFPGTHQFPLRPLPTSKAESADGYSAAVELLSWNLRSLQPGLQLTSEHTEQLTRICWWLDGIPAALIGAASWSLLMPLVELADLAYRDPLTVSESPALQHRPSDLRSDLTTMLSELDPACRAVLDALAALDGELTLPEIAQLTGYPVGQIAHLLHLLLTQNLVRIVEQERETRFCVLNTVSSLLTQTSATTKITATRPSAPHGATPFRSHG